MSNVLLVSAPSMLLLVLQSKSLIQVVVLLPLLTNVQMDHVNLFRPIATSLMVAQSDNPDVLMENAKQTLQIVLALNPVLGSSNAVMGPGLRHKTVLD
jgi:hypothetical protein